MKFALVNGQRQEAQPNLSGECRLCGSPMVAKCGEIRVWHWAHKGHRLCDPWWENETEWHRAWKNQFRVDWQEVVHTAENGERHIADVKTGDGWVIEFQHSSIEPDERRSREAFYGSLIWVVDGLRRKRDRAHFSSAWDKGESSPPRWSKRRVSSAESALLRDWAGSRAHVFFDFGDERSLWWLFPESGNMGAYLQEISRAQVVRVHRETGLSEFDALVENFSAFIAQYESPPPTPRPRRLTEIPPHPTRMTVIRRRFRL